MQNEMVSFCSIPLENLKEGKEKGFFSGDAGNVPGRKKWLKNLAFEV